MKLKYTEFRPSVNRNSVEEVSVSFDDVQGFTRAITKEVTTCLENDAHDVAHKLIDWHRTVQETEILRPGLKLAHDYGGGLDPVGTWEIIA